MILHFSMYCRVSGITCSCKLSLHASVLTLMGELSKVNVLKAWRYFEIKPQWIKIIL